MKNAFIHIIMIVFMIIGCSSTPIQETNKIVITFSAQSYQEQLYKPLMHLFESSNPDIRVQFVSVDPLTLSGLSMSESMRFIAQSADTSSFFLFSPEQMNDNYIYDLKPFMDADSSFKSQDFYPLALQVASKNEKMYVLPHTLHVRMLAYNKSLIGDAEALTPAKSWNWENLRDASVQLTRKNGTNIDVYGLLDPNNGRDTVLGELSADAAFQKTETRSLNTPTVADAVQKALDLKEVGAVHIDANADAHALQHLILDQRVVMWPYAALFYEHGHQVPFEIGIAPFPVLPHVSPVAIEGYFMSSGTQHPQAAWRWLSFLSHQSLANPAPIDPTRLPARTSIADASYWKSLDSDTASAIRVVIERETSNVMLDEVRYRFNEALSQALIAMLRDNVPVEEALQDAQLFYEQALLQDEANRTQPKQELLVATPYPMAVAGSTSIRYANIMGYTNKIDALAKAFHRDNPTIDVNMVSSETFIGSMTVTKLAAAADCFPSFIIPEESEITATLDLQPLADADTNFAQNDYPPVLLAPFKRDGRLIGLPYAVIVRVLQYNTSIFAANGVPFPSEAWTMDDFVSAAQQLTSGSGKDKIYGFAGATPYDVFYFLDHLGASTSIGSDSALRPNFTDPKVQGALNMYLDVLRNSSPHARLENYAQNTQNEETYRLFSEGRIGMMFGFDVHGGNHNVDGASVISVAPPPMSESGPGPHDFFVRGVFISANTQQVASCWSWIKYLSTDPASVLSIGFPAHNAISSADMTAQHISPIGVGVYESYRSRFSLPAQGNAARAFEQSPIDYYWFFLAVDKALQGGNLESELANAQSITEQYVACIQNGQPGNVCAFEVDPQYNGFKNMPQAEVQK